MTDVAIKLIDTFGDEFEPCDKFIAYCREFKNKFIERFSKYSSVDREKYFNKYVHFIAKCSEKFGAKLFL
jgi:hypothetical protein